MRVTCPFCEIEQGRVLYQDRFCFVIRDGFPVTEGHSLVISKRHIGSFFETTEQEKIALIAALEQTKILLDEQFSPDAYNIGVNDGTEAGQTIPHLHIHLIPRYVGDDHDPRGGVRRVIPGKAVYWE